MGCMPGDGTFHGWFPQLAASQRIPPLTIHILIPQGLRPLLAQLERMSKWLRAMGLAGFSTLAYIWTRWPTVREPEEVKCRLAEARRRWTDTQGQALDQNLNGYLSEEFQTFWDRDLRDRDNPSEVERTITRWAKLSEIASDAELVLGEATSEISNALVRFEALAPALAERMTKPLFVVPASELTLATPVFSIIAQKTCMQAMLGLSRVLMARRRPSESVEALLSLIGFANAQLDRGSVISELLAGNALCRAIEGVCQVLTPSTLLPAQDWRRLSLSLSQAVPPDDWLERCLEIEMAAGCGSFALARDGRYLLDPNVRLHLIPGMVAREERIYLNIMTGLLAKLRLGHTLPDDILPKRVAWVLGHTGWTGPLGFLPGERLRQGFWMQRHSLIGMATATAVKAFQAEFGKLPVSLDQVSDAGIVLPPLGPGRLSYQVSERMARVTLPYPVATSWDSEPPVINLGSWGTHKAGTIFVEVTASL